MARRSASARFGDNGHRPVVPLCQCSVCPHCGAQGSYPVLSHRQHPRWRCQKCWKDWTAEEDVDASVARSAITEIVTQQFWVELGVERPRRSTRMPLSVMEA